MSIKSLLHHLIHFVYIYIFIISLQQFSNTHHFWWQKNRPAQVVKRLTLDLAAMTKTLQERTERSSGTMPSEIPFAPECKKVDGMEMDGNGWDGRENVGNVGKVFLFGVNNTFTGEHMENGLKTLRLKSILSWSYLKTLVGDKGEDNIRSTRWPPLCAGSGCSGERIQRYGFCSH